MLGQRNEGLAAIARMERLLAAQADGAAWSNLIGRLYSLADLPARAAPHFRRAVKIAPDNGRFVYDLAACERMIGDLDAARQDIDRALVLDPSNAEALWVRSDLDRASPEHNHIEDLERRLAAGLDPEREIFARYALARECEEIGAWAEAFGHVERGAALRRQGLRYQGLRYDVRRDVAALDRLRAHHTRAAATRAAQGCDDPRPIFIVGLPRTGTTLVERILAGHPRVRLLGETSAFDRALIDVSQATGLGAGEAAVAEAGLDLPMDRLGMAYLTSAGVEGSRELRFVDKQPRNSLNVALIAAALPRARIVLVDRDPIDACWAIHKTLFLGGAYPFAASLPDLADYYAAWRRLADHWLAEFQGQIVHVRYEAVVRDFGAEARRLVAGCGLDWSPKCLDFRSGARPSSTASAVQIRRPLYASSIGLWRHYQAELSPLIERLDDQGALGR